MRGYILLCFLFILIFSLLDTLGIVISFATFIILAIVPPLVICLRKQSAIQYPPRFSRLEYLFLNVSRYINQTFFNENSFLVSAPLVHLALQDKNRGENISANNKLVKAINVAEKQLNVKSKPKYKELNQCLVFAAELSKTGYYKECLKITNEIKPFAEKFKDNKGLKLYMQTLLVACFAAWYLCDLDECESYCNEVLGLAGENNDELYIAERFHAYNFLVLTALIKAEFLKAENFCMESMALAEKTTDGRAKAMFGQMTEVSWAYILSAKGNYAKSEQLLKKIISDYASQKIKQDWYYHRVYCRSSCGLAVLYSLLGLASYAQPYLNILRETLEKPAELHLKIFFANDLAYALLNLGQYEEAEQYLLVAYSMISNNLPKESYIYMTLLNNLADVSIELNKLEKAEGYYLESNSIRTQIFSNKHSSYLRSCLTAARLARAKGDLKDAYNKLVCLQELWSTLYPENLLEQNLVLKELEIVLQEQDLMEESRAIQNRYQSIQKQIRSELIQLPV